jgi:hypothetical protein
LSIKEILFAMVPSPSDNLRVSALQNKSLAAYIRPKATRTHYTTTSSILQLQGQCFISTISKSQSMLYTKVWCKTVTWLFVAISASATMMGINETFVVHSGMNTGA